MDGLKLRLHKNSSLISVYFANLILSLHFFLVLYIYSSYLGKFFDNAAIGFLFVAGSGANLFLFLAAASMMQYTRPIAYLLTAICIEGLSILGLAFSNEPVFIGIFFVVHQAVVPMILYSLDIYLESVNKNEKTTGKLRGLYLTLASAALVISPAIVGFILTNHTFTEVFIFSFIFLIPLFLISKIHISKINIPHPTRHSIMDSFCAAWKAKNVRIAITLHLFLQLFYGFMVIYLPLYLIEEIGFSWSSLGILFSIMLLPFVLFEIPAGWFADKTHKERETLALSFGIICISTSILVFPNSPSFGLWALLLFLTRTGASIAEVTIESFFFKQVTGRDTGTISIFRMMRPIGFILAPVIISISFYVIDLRAAFLVIGGIALIGTYVSSLIKPPSIY